MLHKEGAVALPRRQMKRLSKRLSAVSKLSKKLRAPAREGESDAYDDAEADGPDAEADGLEGEVAEAPSAMAPERSLEEEVPVDATSSLPPGYSYIELIVALDNGRLGAGLDTDYCVTQLLAGGPAERAGLQLDDELIEVNGTLITGTDAPLSALIPHDAPTLTLGIRRPPPKEDDGTSRASPAGAVGARLVAHEVVRLVRSSASESIGMTVEFETPAGSRGVHPVVKIVAEGGIAGRTVRRRRPLPRPGPPRLPPRRPRLPPAAARARAAPLPTPSHPPPRRASCRWATSSSASTAPAPR